MNKILLLGYSNFTQKAIIPALKSHPKNELVAIASKSKFNQIPKEYLAFSDYGEAIRTVSCDTVYISLENSNHFKWIIYALKNNKNVICDKPVVLNARQAKKCVDIAGDNQVVFEAIPYLYHNEHRKLDKLLSKHHSSLQKINVQFGFPLLDKNNFRNKLELGGGCIFDLGPYVVSVGEHYFKKRAEKVYCVGYSKKGLPINVSIIFQFGENEILQASIGFGLEYVNHLEFWGNEFQVSLDRAFTIPTDFENVIHYKDKNQVSIIKVSANNHFYEMFSSFNNLKTSEYKQYNRALLNRLIMLDAINISLKTGQVCKIKY